MSHLSANISNVPERHEVTCISLSKNCTHELYYSTERVGKPFEDSLGKPMDKIRKRKLHHYNTKCASDM
jgi:hypothetical protein